MGKQKTKTEEPVEEPASNKKDEFVFPNADSYKGEYKLNEDETIVRDGYGSFRTSAGLEYTGMWENDKMSGKGYLSFPDGSVYEGEFKDNQFDGQGTYTWPNGCIYKGSFVLNKLEGDGVFVDKEGQTWTGPFHYKAAPGLKFALNM